MDSYLFKYLLNVIEKASNIMLFYRLQPYFLVHPELLAGKTSKALNRSLDGQID